MKKRPDYSSQNTLKSSLRVIGLVFREKQKKRNMTSGKDVVRLTNSRGDRRGPGLKFGVSFNMRTM